MNGPYNRNQPGVIYTHEIKYPNGTINPTERKIIKRNLCIDTLFRKNYDKTSSTNFVYTLPSSINNVISMSVSAVEFANAWYNYTEENRSNEFTITLYNVPTPSDCPQLLTDPSFQYPDVIQHVIKIPSGSYLSALMRDAMNNLLYNTRNGLEYLWFDIDEFSTNCIFRTKTTGDGNNNPEHQNDAIYFIKGEEFYFTVDFRVESLESRPLYRNAGWMMGFKQGFYEVRYRDPPYTNQIETDTTKMSNWYVISESSYGSGIQNYLFLDIDDFNKNFTTNTLVANTDNESYLGNTTMGRIAVSTGMNTIITNNSGDMVFKRREYFGPVKIEKLHIRLLNKYGEPVLMNGNDFSFVLEIEQLYS